MQDIHEWLAGKRSYDAGIKLYFKYGNDPLLTLLFKEEYTEFKRQKIEQVLMQLTGVMIPDKNVDKKQSTEKKKRESVKAAEVKALKEYVGQLNDTADEQHYRIVDIEDSIDDQQRSHQRLESTIDSLQTDIAEVKVRQRLAPKGWPADMDDIIKSLHDRWLLLFSEKKNLQSRIYEIAVSGEKDPEMKKQACKTAHRILELRDQCRSIYDQRDYYLLHNTLPKEEELIEIPADERKWPLTLKNWERYVRDYKVKLRSKPGDENATKQLAKYEWGVAKLKKLLKYE